jgi:pimeloyl-ACP methyl ester carboxylesterase
MKTIVLRINKDLPNYLSHFAKVSISILLLIIYGSAFAQKKYDFQVSIYGKGTPIILIPGYSCSGTVWTETVNHLKDKYECHVLTLPGFAGQAAIKEALLETMRNEIIAYTKAKKLQNPILLGHSLGGFLSLWIASTAPSLFQKVIVVDGVPFYPGMQNPNTSVEEVKKFVDKDALIAQFTSMGDQQLSVYAENIARQLVTDSIKAKTIAEWQVQSDRVTLASAFYEMMTTDIRQDLARITIPVLVLGSKYETLEKSQQILSEQYKYVKKLTLHNTNSKHFIMYDQPIWFFKELDTFLK